MKLQLQERQRSQGGVSGQARRAALAALLGLTTAAALLLSASPASAASTDETKSEAVKPAPSVSPETQRLLDSQSPDKPPAPGGARAFASPQLAGWTTGLSASKTSLWPTQYSTLTATANMNVGPTPYYLSIYDQTSHSYLAICGTGTSCTASVVQSSVTTHSYVSQVSYYPTTYPASGQQASSPAVSVSWHGVSVSLSASPTTLGIGGYSTLTATTNYDVGPSPFYTEIYDATTGTRIGVCGGGTTCSASTTSWAATTHRFVAYVSNYSTAFPPVGVRATSRSVYVTWTPTSFRISLAAPSLSFGSTATATATVNQNVGPTPYWIQIFNTNGTRLAVCGYGTTCSATFTPSSSGTNLVAFVSSSSAAFLPPNIQASSNVTTTTRLVLTIPRPFEAQ